MPDQSTTMNKPDIVLVLLDDLGWRDLSCYGSTFYETPNIDRLAAGGMKFTDAYASCPVCSPTRASLLTGKYPATLGVTDYIDREGAPPRRGKLMDVPYVKQLATGEFNLARALKAGGYQTWHVGKWHLGGEEYYPERQGFDLNIGGSDKGFPHDGYFSPWKIASLPDAPEGTYLTDHITDEAIRLIRTRDPNRPFFLNLWHFAVHTPLQAPRDLVEKYERKARSLGLDAIPEFAGGEEHPMLLLRPKQVFRRTQQSDPVYAAMIENLDTNIGRLLEALGDNTLVLFCSDNGGLNSTVSPTRGLWSAPTTNRPLAEGKGWMYEGGTRGPLIAKWPGKIQPGSVCNAPVTSPDFYPTLLEAAGLPLRPQQHMDGVSFLPALRGAVDFDRGPIFWHYPHYNHSAGTPGSSVRDGDWKLIEFFEDGRLELYNLREDIGETRNLATAHPDIARGLHAKLTAWRQGIEAKIPQPNPDWTE